MKKHGSSCCGTYTKYQVATFFLTYLSYCFYNAARKTFSNVKTSVRLSWAPLDENATLPEGYHEQKVQSYAHPFLESADEVEVFFGVLDTLFLVAYAVGLFISGMLGDRLDLRKVLGGGMCLSAVTSDKVALKSVSGDINCVKVLQGNITIATGNHGRVTTDRLQGQDISVSADSGAVSVKEVYARQTTFESRRGDIQLGNLHGDVQVSCGQGSVGIVSLDGSLQADVDQGNLSAYIVKHTDVNITCKQGDISIKTPAEVQTNLHLQASQGIHTAEEVASKFTSEVGEKAVVQENTKLGRLNEGGASKLTASAPRGSITLSVQSWFDSLQLQK